MTTINFRSWGLKINSNMIDFEIIRDRLVDPCIIYDYYYVIAEVENWNGIQWVQL